MFSKHVHFFICWKCKLWSLTPICCVRDSSKLFLTHQVSLRPTNIWLNSVIWRLIGRSRWFCGFLCYSLCSIIMFAYDILCVIPFYSAFFSPFFSLTLFSLDAIIKNRDVHVSFVYWVDYFSLYKLKNEYIQDVPSMYIHFELLISIGKIWKEMLIELYFGGRPCM